MRELNLRAIETPEASGDEAVGQASHGGGTLSAWIGVAMVVAAFAWTYRDTLKWLVDRWFADPYMGGALVTAPFVAYALWSSREKVRGLRCRGTAWGWPLLVLGALMHLFSITIGYPHPSALSLVPVASGVTIALWGTEVFRRLWAPLALLVFLTPVPLVLDPVTYPLRLASTRMATILPELTGMPYLVEGTTIHLPGYSLGVDIACSGLRSIWSLLFAGAVLAYVLALNWWQSLLVLGMSVPLGVLDNVARIDISIVMGRIFGGEVAEGFFHSGSGIVCFSLTLLILFLIAAAVSRWGSRAGQQR